MPTMTLLGKQTVGSAGAASITFNNIPQTYTDLVVKASIRTDYTYTRDGGLLTFNNSTTGYSGKYVVGYDSGGTGSGSSVTTSFDAWRADGGTATSNTFANIEFYIPNYTSSNYKSFSMDDVTENNSSTSYWLGIMAGLWSNTAAITSIKMAFGGNIVQYSTFLLYGISTTNQETGKTNPSASGGDNIVTDGSYWYHVFLSSGTFTPTRDLKCEYLMVAGGGGGGGYYYAGGGGAGGLRNATNQSLTKSSPYLVTVGAGGSAGANVQFGDGGTGGNSSIAPLGDPTNPLFLANGGGFGAGGNTFRGGDGGSGGGGSTGGGNARAGGSGNIPVTSPSQGNNGGTGYGIPSVVDASGGGGGGAGAAGGNSSQYVGGNGGAGSNAYSSWASATGTGAGGYYAGGGGGGDTYTSGQTAGAGGAGGGGTAQIYGSAGSAGTTNTGGGGGGAGQNSVGYAGGSGLVIIRYPV